MSSSATLVSTCSENCQDSCTRSPMHFPFYCESWVSLPQWLHRMNFLRFPTLNPSLNQTDANFCDCQRLILCQHLSEHGCPHSFRSASSCVLSTWGGPQAFFKWKRSRKGCLDQRTSTHKSTPLTLATAPTTQRDATNETE